MAESCIPVKTVQENMLFMQDIVARLGKKIDLWEEEIQRTPDNQRQAERLLLAQLKLSEVLCRAQTPIEASESALNIFLYYTDYDAGGVYVFDDGQLKLMAHSGLSDRFVNDVKSYSQDRLQVQVVRQSPYFGVYPPQSVTLNEIRAAEGLVDFACMPLLYGNTIIGALNLASHKQVILDAQNKAAIVTAASHLGEVLGRIQMMKELHEQRLQFYALTVASDEAVAILNEGKIIRANRAFCELIGKQEDAIIGLHKSQFIHPEDLDEYFRHKQAGDIHLGDTHSIRMLAPDDTYRTIMVKFKNLKRVNGYEDCVVILAHEWLPRK